MRLFLFKIIIPLVAGLPILAMVLAAGTELNGTKTDLHTALKNKSIVALVTSNGKHNGNSVDLTLTNTLSTTLEVLIPAGTLYHPANDDEQTLLQLEDKIIVLQGKTTQSTTVAAFCSEAGDRCPTKDNAFAMSKTTNPNFLKLTEYIRGKAIDKKTFQDAVWVISDKHDVSHIDANDPTTINFRKYVATLGGKPDSWYTAPREVTVDNGGNFSFQTVKVAGEIAFDCSKGEKIYQDIRKSDGTTQYKGQKYFTPSTNHVTYNFNIQVTGWEQGQYYVYIHNGTTELARYDFTI